MLKDWPWSSYRHFLTGVDGAVEIELDWTAGSREQIRMGEQNRGYLTRKPSLDEYPNLLPDLRRV